MLTRKEVFKTSVIAVALGLMIGCGEFLTSRQADQVKDLEKTLDNSVGANALTEAAKKKKQHQKLKVELKRWRGMLSGAETFFPKSPNPHITHASVVEQLSGNTATLVKCDKGPSTQLSWSPPKAAEGEGSGGGAASDEDAKAMVVKYGEDVLELSLRGDYQSWLDFLVALEKLKTFYRFKDLSLHSASASGKPGSQTELTIDVKLASYHVLEFPSDRKPAEN